MKIIRRLLKFDIIMILILYLLVYILPMGAYYAEKYVREQDGNGFFYYDRLFVLALVGIGCSTYLIAFGLSRRDNLIAYYITTIVSSILNIFLIKAGKYMIYKIAEYVAVYDGKFEIYMSGAGKILYILMGIVNVIALVLSIVGLIFYFIDKFKVGDNTDECKNTVELPVEIIQFRKKIKVVNGCFLGSVLVLFMLLAIASVIYEGDFLSLIIMIPGIVVPFVIYIIVFCNKWIVEGQWIGVILTYIGLIYYAYNMIFYLFGDSIGMTIRYLGFEQNVTSIIITVLLIVMTLVITICGIVDKMNKKREVFYGEKN